MMLMKTADNDPNNFSEFKKSEKQFRHFLKKKTDFTGMIDLNKYDSSMKDICTKSTLVDSTTNKSFEVFKFNFPEGCYVIKNFLTIPEQLALSKTCINDYYKKPNRTNLYIYDPEFNQNKDEPLPTYDKKLFTLDDPQKYYFNRKIRWSNIGFQYDWNDRIYPAGQTAIPADLAEYPLRVLKLMDFGGYKPECVILNYYGQKDYMGGHLDDGEKDQVSPIISFSIGLSCIFLIGGRHKDIKPHPIKLDSGDVLIMSKESRLCYHGVPRVMENSFNPEEFMKYVHENMPKVVENHNQDLMRNEEGEWKNDEIHVINYLTENRINFNFRQVYPTEKEEKDSPKTSS